MGFIFSGGDNILEGDYFGDIFMRRQWWWYLNLVAEGIISEGPVCSSGGGFFSGGGNILEGYYFGDDCMRRRRWYLYFAASVGITLDLDGSVCVGGGMNI